MKNAFLLVIAVLSFVSCTKNTKKEEMNTQKQNLNSTNQIPYTVAQRYFVNKTFDKSQLQNPKIETQEKFDQLFGMATVMGEGGTPTNIDFSKQFVIAVVDDITDSQTEILPISLTQNEAFLDFTYKIKKGQKLSYKMRASLILIVDKKYDQKLRMLVSE